ncbi:hypothetical protein BGW36DRAFT_368593, partial [Talaromyces proteolyticus]
MTSTTAMTLLPITTQIHHAPRSSSDTSTDKTYHLSGGAIAGIVVVASAAVAIVVLIIFRKRIVAYYGRDKTQVADNEHALSSPTYMPPQMQPVLQNDDLAWQASEMSSEQNDIYEIGSIDANPKGNGRVIHEL